MADVQRKAGETVRDSRTAQGLTMEALSVRAGVSYHELSRIERGIVPLSPRAAELLARVLGADAEALLAAHREMRAALRMPELAEVA